MLRLDRSIQLLLDSPVKPGNDSCGVIAVIKGLGLSVSQRGIWVLTGRARGRAKVTTDDHMLILEQYSNLLTETNCRARNGYPSPY